jgi:hypothetical protein
MSKKSLKFPGNGAPLHVPPTESLWRVMLRLQSQWFIHSFISVGVPKTEPSHEMRGKHSHRPRRPKRTEGLHKMECGLVPKGIVNDTSITTPGPCSFSTIPSPDHPPFLGGPEPPLVSVYRSNVQQCILFTPVTASHVTQGRVEYEST